jgi:two-component system response regulator (stage 0 sporulation protein F)
VVDDEVSARQALRRIFESEGYTVVEAENGADALQILTTQSVDLATVDLKMPHMDGLKLLQRMQQTHPGIKAVVITGVEEVIDIAEREPNVIMALTKPFEVKVLQEVIRRGLERLRLPQ